MLFFIKTRIVMKTFPVFLDAGIMQTTEWLFGAGEAIVMLREGLEGGLTHDRLMVLRTLIHLKE